MITVGIFSGILAFSWLDFGWKNYLAYRQRCIYHQYETKKMPTELSTVMDEDKFQRSRCYALDKSNFGFYSGWFSELVSTAILVGSGFKLLWSFSGNLVESVSTYGWLSDEMVQSFVFIVLSNLFSTCISLPFTVYSTFVLEAKYGFNRQTVAFFIKDQIKSFCVSQVIMLPILGVIIKIVNAGIPHFFVYIWLATATFSIILMVVYPELIAPLFDNYVPLPDGELRTAIEALAKSIEFPLYKLFVVDGSRRSAHSNAYFYGFYKFKRIVLFDTLLTKENRVQLQLDTDTSEADDGIENSGCSVPEIVSILGHELGHWSLSHTLKHFVVSQAYILVLCSAFGALHRRPELFTAFGFDPDVEMPTLIGLLIVFQFITAPLNELLSLIMVHVSRRFEFDADAFAADLGHSGGLKSALIKLNKDNLGFPIHDWLFAACHHSHPTLLQRLDRLDMITRPKQD